MHQEVSTLGLIVLMVFLGIHFCALLYLHRLYRQERLFYKTSLATSGVVIGSRRYGGDDGPSFFARISYIVGGTEYMLKGGLWTNVRRYKRGERVTIRYYADSPGDGRVERRWEPFLYLSSAVVFLFPISIIGFLLVREFSR